MSSGFAVGRSASAMAQAASIAPSSPGAATGQRSIGTIVMRKQRGEADFEHVMRAPPRMQDDAASAFAMRIDEIVHRRRDPRLRERGDDEVAFPRAVAVPFPVLHGAAAAHAEMRTDRDDALAARGLHPQQAPAVGMAAPILDLDRLARQRIGDVDRAVRRIDDAIAALAEMRNGEAFDHDAPRRATMRNSRLPSPPSIGEGRAASTVQPSDRMNAAISSHTAA